MEFDDLLKRLGEFGRYQKFVCFAVLSCLVAVPFNNVGIVFIAGVPKHWCFTPELQQLNLSDSVVKNLTIPPEVKDGVNEYSSCRRYKRNYTGWTASDVLEELSTAGNRTGHPEEECKDGWAYDTSVYISTVVSEVRAK